MQSADVGLFIALHDLAGHTAFIDALIVFFGEYFFYVIMFLVAYYLYQALRTDGSVRVYVVAFAAAIIARFGVTELIRLFYHRPRPFIALQLPHLLTDISHSFPSGHTIFMFALATVIYSSDKTFGRFLFAAGLLIGIARVAGGVHYPSDIVGGIVLGFCTGHAVTFLWKHVRGHTLDTITP